MNQKREIEKNKGRGTTNTKLQKRINISDNTLVMLILQCF